MTLPATIDVGVCTFRRPEQLDAALGSIMRQDLPEGTRVRVLVVDNDEAPSAEPIASAMAQSAPLPIVYLHAPGRNISIARNACLELSASSDYLAFTDDDAVVCRDWLAALYRAIRAEGVDAVFGPSVAIYDDVTPSWVRCGDYHSARPVFVSGEIRTGYSGNVLLRRGGSAWLAERFDLSLGRTGGEDTEFFHRLWKAGARFGSAPDALVYERVPRGRATFGWLARRRYRSGQTIASLAPAGRIGSGRVPRLIMALSKATFCMAGAAVCVWSPSRLRRWILRGAMHAGAAGRLLGMRKVELY